MKLLRWLILSWLLLVAGVTLQSQAYWQSRAQVTGVAPPACVGTYTGPGDVAGAGGALLWGGLRSYTAALCGNALANVCNSTGGVDVGCADMFSNNATGALVSATVGGITCPGANCTVKTLYDQTVGGHCTGSCDLTQATIANRPLLLANCTGLTSRPCMQTSGASAAIGTAGSMSLAWPFSILTTGIRTVTSATHFAVLLGIGNADFVNSTANTLQFACDNTILLLPETVADNTWHNLAQTCAVASSGTITAYSNGTSLGSNTGAGSATQSGTPFVLFADNDTIQQVEIGIYGSAIDGSAAALSTNQRSFYGF